MTLIFSYISPVTGLFTASDILLSGPVGLEKGDVKLPFRDQPLSMENDGFTPTGLVQKSVVLGRTMILFAGRLIVARAIIQQIRIESNEGQNQVNLIQLINNIGLSNQELASVSIIYHYSLSAAMLVRTQFNCDIRNISGGTDIYVSGTGTWNFFDRLRDLSEGNFNTHEKVLANLLGRISHHAILEHTGTESLDYMYGGWFEITTRQDKGFIKIPYAVRLWARKSGLIGSGGPIFFGWHDNFSLNIMRFQPQEQDGKIVIKHVHQVVPDFLGRGTSRAPTKTIRPFFIMHIVIDEDEPGTFSTLIEHDSDDRDMNLEVSPNRVRVAWKPRLIARLLALGAGVAEAPSVFDPLYM